MKTLYCVYPEYDSHETVWDPTVYFSDKISDVDTMYLHEGIGYESFYPFPPGSDFKKGTFCLDMFKQFAGFTPEPGKMFVIEFNIKAAPKLTNV